MQRECLTEWIMGNLRHTRSTNNRYSINVWYEILNTCLIDPYSICHNTLYAEGNRYFLEFTLPNLPCDVPPETRNSLKYYQRHRAPAHNVRTVTRYLISIYGGKWFDIRQPCHHVHVHVTKILFTPCGIFFIKTDCIQNLLFPLVTWKNE